MNNVKFAVKLIIGFAIAVGVGGFIVANWSGYFQNA